jgi:hypothetical protein
METQMVIAEHLGYLSRVEGQKLTAASGEVSRLLHDLMQAIQRMDLQPSKN